MEQEISRWTVRLFAIAVPCCVGICTIQYTMAIPPDGCHQIARSNFINETGDEPHSGAGCLKKSKPVECRLPRLRTYAVFQLERRKR